MDYDKLNRHIDDLKRRDIANPCIGVAVKAVPVIISDVNRHALKRCITKEEAQNYVDNAKVMLRQKNGRNNYLSDDGAAILLIENNRLISAYSKKDFDPAIKSIIEVINHERS